MNDDDPLAIATALGMAIVQAGGRWAIGGSVASSVHGVPRTTQDIDLIVALSPATGPGGGGGCGSREVTARRSFARASRHVRGWTKKRDGGRIRA